MPVQQTCPRCGTVFTDQPECPSCAAIHPPDAAGRQPVNPPKTAAAMHQRTCYVWGTTYTAFTDPAPCPACAVQSRPAASPGLTARQYVEIVGIWAMLAGGLYLGFRRTWPLGAILATATVITLVRVFWLKNVGSFKEDKATSRRFTLIYLGLLGVAVVIVLLAAAFPLFVSLSESDKRDRAKVEIGNLERAVERWLNDKGELPASLETLTRAGRLDDNALTDPWGDPYLYDPAQINPIKGTPRIYSTGGTKDGTGTISNW